MSSALIRKLLRFRDLLWTSATLLSEKRPRQQARQPSLYYIIPEANWVTDWVGRYITQEIRQSCGLKAHLTSVPEILSGQVIHYGEMGAFINSLGKPCNTRNAIIATIFHGALGDQFPSLAAHTECFLQNAHLPLRIHTASQIMRQRLLSWGIPENKLSCIPLGIDLKSFFPAEKERREHARRELEIPAGRLCIGSFQKDGDGWGEGLNPKLVKGPDLLLAVLEELNKQLPITVLLSGPARGYVKKGLHQLKIPFRHQMVRHYPDICRFYHALDLYLVTSREEGGPLAILESLATGIPIVSTEVGLAPDLIRHNWNGCLAKVEDIDSLVKFSADLLESPDKHAQFRQNGLKSIEEYDWQFIARRYYQEIYNPIFQNL